MEDPDLKKLLEILLRSKGFDGRQYKPNYIKRRIAVRMRALGATGYGDYSRHLLEDPGESALLFDRLTIHVTEFFRDPDVYRALRTKVFPALPETTSGKVKVWCAGCSTGEEPYSVAMMLEEWILAHPGRSYDLLATDLDPGSLRTGEKGEYPKESLRGLSGTQIAKWFRTDGSRAWVTTELKQRIRFRVHDLLSDWGPGFSRFHVIFCRNLLIYLVGVEQQSIYEKFAGALHPGGFLVLGLTETLLGPSRRFFKCVDVRHRIYQSLAEPEIKD